MGVVTVPSSASRSPFGGTTISVRRSPTLRRPFLVIAFRVDKASRSCALATQSEAATIPPEVVKEPKKRSRRAAKQPKRVSAAAAESVPAAAPSMDCCPPELDYNEVAAALENIYKLSPAVEEEIGRAKKENYNQKSDTVVRNRNKTAKRLSLEGRVTLKQRKKEKTEVTAVKRQGKESKEDVERLVREYSGSTDLNSLDWKKMKIPPVLSSVDQNRLFKLMQPMKAIFGVKENLYKDLSREPTDGEVAAAVNMSVPELRRRIEVGQAARNKLIKHNLRLVIFVINKYYPDVASSQKFQDLCQAGAKGLMTAIDRFELRRGFRLSTYSIFWIRHSIIRSMTISSFTKVPFGIESVKQEIKKVKLELSLELGRSPAEEEIVERVGISIERYRNIVKASKPVLSLNARHAVTQEEFINGVTDIDGAGGVKRRQPAVLRLALDDVLDSLKPKESLVIRQRYGLDGKGDRTLGEIAGNLNISREMVRKHELKALLKLKHPARVEYLRRYV